MKAALYILFTVFIGVGLIMLALSFAGSTGNASTTNNAAAEDSVYISTLDQYNIPYSSATNAIAAAHSICDELANGTTGSAIIFTIAAGTTYSQTQAGAIVGASVGSYCPQFKTISQE
jgi:hypothetical protein